MHSPEHWALVLSASACCVTVVRSLPLSWPQSPYLRHEGVIPLGEAKDGGEHSAVHSAAPVAKHCVAPATPRV